MEYNYKLHVGKTDLITNKWRKTYARQTIYKHTHPSIKMLTGGGYYSTSHYSKII